MGLEKDLPENLVKLIGYLAWPTIVIFTSVLFYGPLSQLVETLGRRITKFSAFKLNIELGRLSQAQSLSATVESLRKITVTESGLAQIVAGVIKSGSADYVLVELGKDDEEEWITSRLFLLAAILERSRAARCLVFLGEKKQFLGAATARDVRTSLGARFLVYESAFASAYGRLAQTDPNVFRGGLSETLVNELTNGFLQNSLISLPYQPPSVIGWIKLERVPPLPTTWEFADWMTAAGLRDILGQHLLTGSVVAVVGRATPEVTKSVVAAAGMFVALVNKDGSFLDLCDRYTVLESFAREALEQSSDK
jgi:hypothetical protein